MFLTYYLKILDIYLIIFEKILLFLLSDGNWGHWQHWSTCSVTCGGGDRDRVRVCDDPPQSNGGLNCEGPDRQHDNNCNHFTCPEGPSKYLLPTFIKIAYLKTFLC